MYVIRITENKKVKQSQKRFRTKKAANAILKRIPSKFRPRIIKV